MPAFVKGGAAKTPFGKNEFLRSTRDIKTESYTCSAASVTVETIDGATTQKILQSGEVISKITSTAEAGKVGPTQAAAADGRDVTTGVTNIVGLNMTFLPWQLMEHDTEISVVYECTAVLAWCTERNAAGARIPLATAAVITAMKAGGTASGVSIIFK